MPSPKPISYPSVNDPYSNKHPEGLWWQLVMQEASARKQQRFEGSNAAGPGGSEAGSREAAACAEQQS